MNAVDPAAVIPDGGDDGTPVETSQDNPAWSDFLSGIPESMHDMVKPHLSKWDAGVNQRIQQVHQEYADFKPYREAGITADQLSQAYGIFEAINSDPRRVYDILGETYGYTVPSPQQGAPVVPQPNTQQQNQPTSFEYDLGNPAAQQPDIKQHPDFLRLQQMTETMANMLLQQEQQRKVAEEDAALDRELQSAKAKFGEFDERFVLGYVQTGVSMENAVKAYQEIANGIRSSTNRPAAPNVLGTGPSSGQLPSNQIDPAKLSDNDRRALVANVMRAANQQG